MLENISEATNNGHKKKMIILIAGVIVLALVLGVGGICWSIQHSSRMKEARKQCEIKVAQVSKASQSWKKLTKNSLLISFAQDNSENGKLLAKLLKQRLPETVVCNANSPEELGSQGAQAIAATQWYSDNAQRIRGVTSAMIDKLSAASTDTTANAQEKQKAEESQKELQKITAPVIRIAPKVKRKPNIIIQNIPPTQEEKVQADNAMQKKIEEAKRQADEQAAKAKAKAKSDAEKRRLELERRKRIRDAYENLQKQLEEQARRKAEEEKKNNDKKNNDGGEGGNNNQPPAPNPPVQPAPNPAPNPANNGGANGGTDHPSTTTQPPAQDTNTTH
ncbi:hypothetical protein [Gardnerella vaginalis]|uniref:hypothetical protein n=1 Tax=Gardnerella vaginalis TaxID=2702 RepID=UPI00030AE637|nr:hypothetical protein [Gardnerella vaginalis]